MIRPLAHALAFGLLVGALLGASAGAAAQRDVARRRAAGAGTTPARAAPEWRWMQALASPRIGERLTAIAVDPADPERVYVGTETGTILRSDDGGTTWRELLPEPFGGTRRDVGGPPPPDGCEGPECGESSIFFSRPPFRFNRPSAYNIAPQLTDALFPSSLGLPRFMRLIAPVSFDEDAPPDLDFLEQATEERPTEAVRRIALCAGSPLPLVIATEREVLGSPDGGLSWLRLLRFPGRVRTPQVACDPTRPGHLAIASERGLQESTDGGLTLDPDLNGWPRNAVETVHFAADGTLWMGSGFELVRRRPGEDAPQRVYPDFEASETAPWEDILWIDSVGDTVWFATEDGIRRGLDGGRRFERVTSTRFARQRALQVQVGRGEEGGRRVAAVVRDCGTEIPDRDPGCRTTEVLASDDDGATWAPFFAGITRRSVQQIAFAGGATRGRWFVLTGGELWVTARSRPGAVSTQTLEWARRRIGRTPPLRLVIDRALEGTGLDRETIDGLFARARRRGGAPERLFVRGLASHGGFRRGFVSGPAPLVADRSDRGWDAAVFVGLQWELEESLGVQPDELVDAREALYALRRRIAFAVEDAWHERLLHLRRLARGFADPFQASVLRARVAMLEAGLEVWLRQPLEAL